MQIRNKRLQNYIRMKLMIFVLAAFNTSYAKDFGTAGMSFAVEEEGFVAMIKRRLSSINIAEQQQRMQDIVRNRVNNPIPVSRISRASRTISHSFDPSYVLPEDIILPCGKLLYRAGMIINPLDYISMQAKLVFIDGQDQDQLEWLKSKFIETMHAKKTNVDESREDIKIILVAGRPLELADQLKQNVYFDQFAELTRKFNIQNVPAIAEQEGKVIKITEINIGNEYEQK